MEVPRRGTYAKDLPVVPLLTRRRTFMPWVITALIDAFGLGIAGSVTRWLTALLWPPRRASS